MRLYITRLFILFTLFAASVLGVVHADEVLLFNNGDRLTGELLEETPESIRFRSPVLGELTVPASEARVQAAAPPPSPTAVASPLNKPEEPAPPTPGALEARESKVKAWIASVVPEGWHGRIDVGANRVSSGSTSTQINATGKIGTKSGPNSYDFKAYYYYDASQDTSNVLTISTNKFGGDFDYRHDLDSRWFIENELGYLRDFQANIRHQVQDTARLGYKVVQTKAIDFTLEVGPSALYVDAPGLTEHWYYLSSAKEKFVWRFLPPLRLEQEASYFFDPFRTSNYAWKVDVALIHNMTDWLELALRYRRSFNAIVGFDGVKNEEMISITLGLPF